MQFHVSIAGVKKGDLKSPVIATTATTTTRTTTTTTTAVVGEMENQNGDDRSEIITYTQRCIKIHSVPCDFYARAFTWLLRPAFLWPLNQSTNKRK